MKRFSHVVEILETAVNGENIKAHGPFWRGKTLDQFVALKIFGQQLIVRGNAGNSAIIKALRGRAPFGADVTPRPDGAIFRRMPAGRAPVGEDSIAFIETWINDGCPDDEVAAPGPAAETVVAGGVAGNFDLYNRFFREFDDFFQFQADPATGQEIGTFFGVAQNWPGFSRTAQPANWQNQIRGADVSAAIKSLSDSQLRIMRSFFGTPIAFDAFADA